MKNALVYWQWVRGKNLLMIALTQWIIVWVTKQSGCDISALSLITLACISISTIGIAAAGYLYNNIIDIETDRTNNKVVIHHIHEERISYLKKGSYAVAIASHIPVLFMLYSTENRSALLIFPIASALLFFYSKYIKSTLLAGNLLIALLTVMSMHVIVQYLVYRCENSIMFLFIYAYMFFAFMCSVLREIVKDIEDVEGDLAHDIITLPGKFGIQFAKKISIYLNLFILFLLVFTGIGLFINKQFGILIQLVTVLLTILGSIVLFVLYKSKTKSDFSGCSNWIKLWMLIGILSMLTIPFCV